MILMQTVSGSSRVPEADAASAGKNEKTERSSSGPSFLSFLEKAGQGKTEKKNSARPSEKAEAETAEALSDGKDRPETLRRFLSKFQLHTETESTTSEKSGKSEKSVKVLKKSPSEQKNAGAEAEDASGAETLLAPAQSSADAELLKAGGVRSGAEQKPAGPEAVSAEPGAGAVAGKTGRMQNGSEENFPGSEKPAGRKTSTTRTASADTGVQNSGGEGALRVDAETSAGKEREISRKAGASGESVPEGRKNFRSDRRGEQGTEESEAVRLEVTDRRTVTAESRSGGDAASSGSFSGEPGGEADFLEQIAGEEDGFSRQFAEVSNSTASRPASEVRGPLQQEQTQHVLRQLREEGNEKIVRNARIILKDGDQGEIRLQLRPERLGSVRISLFLEDNHIAGRIIVDNSTVREAFEQNLQYLQQAFAQEGFSSANLEVSVGSRGRGDEQPHQEGGRKNIHIREIERSTTPAGEYHDGYLNLVV